MRSVPLKRSFALVAVCMLAACSGDSATGVQANSTLDAALAQIALPSVSGLFSTVVGVPSVADLGGAVPSACSYDASSKSFACATITASGLTFTRGFTLYDAAGNAQAAFDAGTTASIRTVGTVKGTMTGVQGISSGLAIDESQDLTLSGLLGAERVINGSSNGKVTGNTSVGGVTQAVSIIETTTFNKITLPANATSSTYPTSGSIASDVTTTLGSTSVQTQVTMTFNGTSKVTVSINVNGHTTTCIMDTTNPGSCG